MMNEQRINIEHQGKKLDVIFTDMRDGWLRIKVKKAGSEAVYIKYMTKTEFFSGMAIT